MCFGAENLDNKNSFDRDIKSKITYIFSILLGVIKVGGLLSALEQKSGTIKQLWQKNKSQYYMYHIVEKTFRLALISLSICL